MDDQINSVLAQQSALVNSNNVISVPGRIATVSMLAQWRYRLARRNIAIEPISGKLDRLTITCGENTVASAYSNKAEWHIPKSWSACDVTVYGAPGASFTLVQMPE